MSGMSAGSLLSSLPGMHSYHPAVKKLLGWKQGDEEEKWAERAIESLVKKLKKTKGSLDSLEVALAERTPNSQCVCIERSLDGRLQVSHRKALPHVIYCRVWRWPDLQTHHELKAMPHCRYSFETKQKQICINPYHYTRVETTVLPPVLVPRYTNTSSSSFSTPPYANNYLPFQVLEHDTNGAHTFPENKFLPHGSNQSPYQTPSPQPYSPQSNGSPQSNMGSSFGSPPPSHSLNHSGQSCGGINENMETDVQHNPVPYEALQHWCSVSYYELNSRVGEIFKLRNHRITVDGFTDPSGGDRISLGGLSNINRNITVENTRKHIGRGVVLTFERGREGRRDSVWAECLSDSAIFIQSRCTNYTNNFNPTTVCKLPSKQKLCIFEFDKFRELLAQACQQQHGYDAVFGLTKFCSIRMSFVKGWGTEYNRADVTSTPCWVEIHLFDALNWLDRVLNTMGPSNTVISSYS